MLAPIVISAERAAGIFVPVHCARLKVHVMVEQAMVGMPDLEPTEYAGAFTRGRRPCHRAHGGRLTLKLLRMKRLVTILSDLGCSSFRASRCLSGLVSSAIVPSNHSRVVVAGRDPFSMVR
jgi:hypothetical protein